MDYALARIDATVLILGHPSSVVDRAINECDARLVNISGPEVRAFIEANDDYVYSSIPRSVYGKKGGILSIGVLATLVTRTDIPDDIVAAIIKNTIANLPSIGVSAAVLEKLSVRDMRSRA